MKDPFGREINYLRVSVTDRCNLRCRYCRPAQGIPLVPSDDILSFDAILEVVLEAVALGVNKVRLTGGEPLVRPHIVHLVEMLSQIHAITDLCMSTNGTFLARHADALAAAGLGRVNISLDTMSPDRYAYITRGGDIDTVLAGIEAARAAGLDPIKLNCVVEKSAHEPDARAVAHFARDNDLQLRFITRMDPPTGQFSVVQGGTAGDCEHCNRLRLSPDGLVIPCLFSDIAYSVRELGAANALKTAIRNKPKHGGPCHHNWIATIGG